MSSSPTAVGEAVCCRLRLALTPLRELDRSSAPRAVLTSMPRQERCTPGRLGRQALDPQAVSEGFTTSHWLDERGDTLGTFVAQARLLRGARLNALSCDDAVNTARRDACCTPRVARWLSVRPGSLSVTMSHARVQRSTATSTHDHAYVLL